MKHSLGPTFHIDFPLSGLFITFKNNVDYFYRPIRVPVFYWPMLDKAPTPCPFVDAESLDTFTYALPDLEYPGLIKVTGKEKILTINFNVCLQMGYHGGPACDPSRRDLIGTEYIERMMSDYIKQSIPWLGTSPCIREPCMYTVRRLVMFEICITNLSRVVDVS